MSVNYRVKAFSSPKLPTTLPYLEKWVPDREIEGLTPECLRDQFSAPANSKDVSTQTPDSFLYMAIAEITKKGNQEVERCYNRRGSATDWVEMGRELRSIADELRSTSMDPLEDNEEESSNWRSMCSMLFGVPKGNRRRSLPDGASLLRHPPH